MKPASSLPRGSAGASRGERQTHKMSDSPESESKPDRSHHGNRRKGGGRRSAASRREAGEAPLRSPFRVGSPIVPSTRPALTCRESHPRGTPPPPPPPPPQSTPLYPTFPRYVTASCNGSPYRRRPSSHEAAVTTVDHVPGLHDEQPGARPMAGEASTIAAGDAPSDRLGNTAPTLGHSPPGHQFNTSPAASLGRETGFNAPGALRRPKQ